MTIDFTPLEGVAERLPKSKLHQYCYTSLTTMTKSIWQQQGYDADVLFNEYCIFEPPTDFDSPQHKFVTKYWQVYKSFYNNITYGDTLSFDLPTIQKRDIPRMFFAINLYTLVKYGLFLPLHFQHLTLTEDEIHQAIEEVATQWIS